MKTSRIKKCEFQDEWRAPDGKILYIHLIEFSNGDVGTIFKRAKNPSEIAVGVEVDYTIEKGKLKIHEVADVPQRRTSQRQGKSYSGPGNGFKKKPDDFLGFAYAYAKDLVIAGKTKETDVKALKKIAEQIYLHIGELLDKDKSVAPESKNNASDNEEHN